MILKFNLFKQQVTKPKYILLYNQKMNHHQTILNGQKWTFRFLKTKQSSKLIVVPPPTNN